jgi:centromeric protein E
MMTSEMDVSRVDPEEVLVDAQNVEVDEVGDVSVDESDGKEYGKEDKVLVSIRIRPTDSQNAWSVPPSPSATTTTLNLLPEFSNKSPPTEYTFDEILTGSANKPVYNAVARSHVCAAMDGYNAVIFAYGQTASGKTFTLVSIFI